MLLCSETKFSRAHKHDHSEGVPTDPQTDVQTETQTDSLVHATSGINIKTYIRTMDLAPTSDTDVYFGYNDCIVELQP